MDPFWLALPGFIIWFVVITLPWRPWVTRESLDVIPSVHADLAKLTVLIPARNEEAVITQTLKALDRQGQEHHILLVDDQSSDDTVSLAARLKIPNLKTLSGEPLPEGWTGKLWALEQGRRMIQTEYILLLDADIELRPGMIKTLLHKLDAERLDMVSLMAYLRMESFWERLLMPAFVYFFKMLYPFQISNSASRLVAAAAGGCILVKRSVLEDAGGFSALKDEIIDDCALARRLKDHGYRTWIGLTHSAISHRQYNDVRTIWEMVARTAFTQLHQSGVLLALCTIVLLAAFLLPPFAFLFGGVEATLTALASILMMVISYLPTLKYYDQAPAWALLLPVTAVLYLLMTWTSAVRHWQGKGPTWKDRHYGAAR